MIKSFKHKGLEDFFNEAITKGIQLKHSDKISMVLDLLDAADNINVMNFPGSYLHKLNPKKDEIWSIKISGNWRITFKFIDGDAFIIDYLDYH